MSDRVDAWDEHRQPRGCRFAIKGVWLMRRILMACLLVCLLALLGWVVWRLWWSGWGKEEKPSPTAAPKGTATASQAAATITPQASATWTAIVTVMDTQAAATHVAPAVEAWTETPRPPRDTPEAARSGVLCRRVVESRWSEFLLCKVLGDRYGFK